MSYFVELKSFLFSTRRKRVDFYLFVLLIVALWAGRSPFNAWLVETIGEKMVTVSIFFVGYPWLLYCLCALIVLGTGLYVLNHIQDHYSSFHESFITSNFELNGNPSNCVHTPIVVVNNASMIIFEIEVKDPRKLILAENQMYPA